MTSSQKISAALKFIRGLEWKMGNGQCDECCGSQPRAGWWTDTVGHEKGCKVGKLIEKLGGKVVWERENHSKKRREADRFFAGCKKGGSK